MEAERIQIKFFTREADVSLEPFVRVFHSWIKDEAVDDVLIDVADYSHVHHGPGVLLIGHGANYSVDVSDGRPGLLYSRKRAAPAPHERLRDAFRRALGAVELLEREPSLPRGFGFRTDELWLRVPDRLVARNDPSGLERLGPEIETFLHRFYAGTAFRIEQQGGPKIPFTVRVTASEAPTVPALLARLAGEA